MTLLNRPNRAVTISLEGRLVKGGRIGSHDSKRLDMGANSRIGQSYSTASDDNMQMMTTTSEGNVDQVMLVPSHGWSEIQLGGVGVMRCVAVGRMAEEKEKEK